MSMRSLQGRRTTGPIHAMNAEQRQSATDPWTKPRTWAIGPLLGSYETTSTIAIIITQPGSWYSFYRPIEGRRLSRPRWLVIYPDGLPAHDQSPIQVVTGPSVD